MRNAAGWRAGSSTSFSCIWLISPIVLLSTINSPYRPFGLQNKWQSFECFTPYLLVEWYDQHWTTGASLVLGLPTPPGPEAGTPPQVLWFCPLLSLVLEGRERSSPLYFHRMPLTTSSRLLVSTDYWSLVHSTRGLQDPGKKHLPGTSLHAFTT